MARRTVMGSRAFVREEKRLRKMRPGNDPIFYHFKEAFVGFAESQKEDHQFNPITSFPWCYVAKIKIKPPLFDGQKAKTYNPTIQEKTIGATRLASVLAKCTYVLEEGAELQKQGVDME